MLRMTINPYAEAYNLLRENWEAYEPFARMKERAPEASSPKIRLLCLIHSINTPLPHLGPLVHHLAKQGEDDRVEVLIAAKCNPDVQDGFGRTALHWAAAKGHQAVIDRLLAAGADTELLDFKGKTYTQILAGEDHRE